MPSAVRLREDYSAVTGVVAPPHYAREPAEIRQLRPLRLEIGKAGTVQSPGVADGVAELEADERDAIEERAGLAADSAPGCYLDAWARLQCQRPLSIDEDDWRRAIDDAGLFLDVWGADAAAMQWSGGELFDMPRQGLPGGLVWQLMGERVDALGEHRARLADGRTIIRSRRPGRATLL
jgi:hypothetical protein